MSTEEIQTLIARFDRQDKILLDHDLVLEDLSHGRRENADGIGRLMAGQAEMSKQIENLNERLLGVPGHPDKVGALEWIDSRRKMEKTIMNWRDYLARTVVSALLFAIAAAWVDHRASQHIEEAQRASQPQGSKP